MRVRIIQRDGSIKFGSANLSPSRDKTRSVNISFDEPLRTWWPLTRWELENNAGPALRNNSTNEEFYLTGEHIGQIMIWGQGMEYPNDSLRLHMDDLAEIVKGGGG